MGLAEYFDAVVCSDEVAHPKPAPDAARECLRRLSAPRMEKMLDMADALLRNTKVLELGCNISLDAVDTVYQALVGQEEVK